MHGFVFNPLHTGDPKFNYYTFSIYASISANQGGWVVGLPGNSGPSFVLNVTSPNGNIISSQIQPSGDDPINAADPTTVSDSQSFSLELCYGSFCATPSYSSSESTTFYALVSDTTSHLYGQNEVTWDSTTMSSTTSYTFGFLAGMKVPVGEQPQLDVSLQGNFYSPYIYESSAHGCNGWHLWLDPCYATGYHIDSPTLPFTGNFSAPSESIITSNPGGQGFVELNGNSTLSPTSFVFNPGVVYTLTASRMVYTEAGERYVFANWTDGGQLSHIIKTQATPITYQANFQRQDEINVSSTDGGQTDPPLGSYWFNSTQSATFHAIPNSGYALRSWVVDGVDVGNASAISVTMDSPHSLTEVFVPAAEVLRSPPSPSSPSKASPNSTITVTDTASSSNIITSTSTTLQGQAVISITTTTIITSSESINSFLTDNLVLVVASAVILVMFGVAIGSLARRAK